MRANRVTTLSFIDSTPFHMGYGGCKAPSKPLPLYAPSPYHRHWRSLPKRREDMTEGHGSTGVV